MQRERETERNTQRLEDRERIKRDRGRKGKNEKERERERLWVSTTFGIISAWLCFAIHASQQLTSLQFRIFDTSATGLCGTTRSYLSKIDHEIPSCAQRTKNNWHFWSSPPRLRLLQWPAYDDPYRPSRHETPAPRWNIIHWDKHFLFPCFSLYVYQLLPTC